MSDNLVSPGAGVTLGGEPYALGGDFATLRAVQHAFGEDILRVQARIPDMRVDEIARLIAAASGGDEQEVGALLLDEVDVTGVDYQLLKARLMGWLAVALAPKRDREKKTEQVAGMIERLTPRGGKSASPGKNTKASA